MPTDFIFFFVPRSILVGRALHGAVLNLIGRPCGIDCRIKCDLDPLVPLLPIHGKVEINRIGCVRQPDRLHEGRFSVLSYDSKSGPDAVLHRFHRLHIGQADIFLLVVVLQIPCVITSDIVAVSPQFVAVSTIFQNLPAVFFVVERCNPHGIVKGQAVSLAFADRAGDLHGICILERLHAGVALGRNVFNRNAFSV